MRTFHAAALIRVPGFAFKHISHRDVDRFRAMDRLNVYHKSRKCITPSVAKKKRELAVKNGYGHF